MTAGENSMATIWQLIATFNGSLQKKVNNFNATKMKRQEGFSTCWLSRLGCLMALLGIYGMPAQGAPRDVQQGLEKPIEDFQLSPAHGSRQINPDTHLSITFAREPVLGTTGKIRVFDASNDHLVDELDLSIPAGPTKPVTGPKAPYTPTPYLYSTDKFTNATIKPGTPSGLAEQTPDSLQLTIIGGFTDAFHFYPVIIHGCTATI
jgi:hypothetical protein